MGFTFDDTDSKGVASPLSEMRRLIQIGSHNREVIFPYIGGDEVNTSASHSHHRYVIDFRDRSEQECRQRWPDVFAIVEEMVKPERTRRDRSGAYVLREPLPTRWWHHADKRPALYAAIAGLKRVPVISRIGQHAAFSFVPAAMVFSDSLIVFPVDTYAAFCAFQSRPHEIWARFFGSSMKDDLRYTPSDCFETFTFPEDWETHPALEASGEAYYAFRAALMVGNNEGLTKTYNRFHDPDDSDPGIVRLRELHSDMDRSVLDAYGWTDIDTHCQFLLDYEIDEEEWGDKKKPYRYRWPAEVRDEVLARLLELNAERARVELRSGAADKKRSKKKGAKTAVASQADDLFS
jgi:hypothetical protein